MLDLATVDDLFAAEHAQGRAPGLVYAVVRDGEIVHSRGLGTTTPDGTAAPDVDSVQRIASMTKSFTAAAVLLLRDAGRLRLDDPVAVHVPELAGHRHAADAPDLTLRHLLTMSGGLLTDDPWGDRNESQTHEDLGRLLAEGFTTGAVPGVGFEYSNLGYAILGRVVDALTGGEGGYRRFVLREITGPLGMAATAYDVREVGPALVRGHRRVGDGWAPEPPTVPGTFSAMGGLHSSLHDLARWVGGFTDAFRRPEAPHPLSAASRREMQQLQRLVGVSGTLALAVPPGGAALAASATGYGLGLFVEQHSDHGTVVQHSGGYPGYGSHMRWHPETGLGVIALANGTYAAPVETSRDALRALVASQRAPERAPRPAPRGTVVATPALLEAVTRTLEAPEEPLDPDLFTFNVELDVPAEERRAQLVAARELVGAPTGPATAPRAAGLGLVSWSVPAERGRYDLEVKVAPTLRPAVQSLAVTAVPEPPAGLLAAAARALAGEPDAVAPGEGTEGARVDADAFVRAVVASTALGAGTPRIVGALAGDGATTATLAVRAGTTWWRLEVAGPEPLTALSLTPVPTAEHPALERRFPA